MHIPTLVRHHPLVTTLSVVIITPLMVFALWAFFTLHVSYAKSHAAGYLQKISQRGWLCKTWEGDLQVTALPGAAPEVFRFSSRSDSIAAELNRMAGQRVVVSYEQHKGVPGSCFGETEYFVTGVRPVQ